MKFRPVGLLRGAAVGRAGPGLEGGMVTSTRPSSPPLCGHSSQTWLGSAVALGTPSVIRR